MGYCLPRVTDQATSTVLDKKTDLGPLLALGPAGCRAMEGGDVLALQLSPADLRGRQERNLYCAGEWHEALRRMLELEQLVTNTFSRFVARWHHSIPACITKV